MTLFPKQLQASEGQCHLSHRLPQARAPHTQTDLCCPICLKKNFLEVNLLCEHYSKPKTSEHPSNTYILPLGRIEITMSRLRYRAICQDENMLGWEGDQNLFEHECYQNVYNLNLYMSTRSNALKVSRFKSTWRRGDFIQDCYCTNFLCATEKKPKKNYNKNVVTRRSCYM